MHYELCIVFGRSGFAVGLSAISLLAPLAKDAAPIPNALEATKSKLQTLILTNKALPYPIFVSPFQGIPSTPQFFNSSYP